MARLICAGHASCDLPFRPVDRRVFDTDTVYAESCSVLTGGDALNTTMGLNKLGMGKQTRLVSVVGDDTYGRLTLNYLKRHGIDVSGIIVKPEYSSIVTVILIESSNERHFICHGNAAHHITVDDVLAHIGPDTEYIHIGSYMSLTALERENMIRLFSYAKERGIQTSFDVTGDPGNGLVKIEAGLPYTDIFFASYGEAVALSGGLREPEEIAKFFEKTGVKKFVLKLGKGGCYATDFSQTISVPTYPEEPVVDTTGAGDSFVAAYLYGVMRGFTMEECCVLGNINGTLVVGHFGSHTGAGTVDDFRQFLREHGAKTLDANDLLEKL